MNLIHSPFYTHTGADKGPFWGEKKRYPTVLEFNPNDEAHTSFLLSTTCLLGVALGLLPAKAEDDDQWMKEYRSPEFIAQLASTLVPPPYVQAPVTSPDIEGDNLCTSLHTYIHAFADTQLRTYFDHHAPSSHILNLVKTLV